MTDYNTLPLLHAQVHAREITGPFPIHHHSIGHGGINSRPLPAPVIAGSRALAPKLLRTFIQEYFFLCPKPGQYDFTRLDPYMQSLADTGAQIVAAICIKPKALFPAIDPASWAPSHWELWQDLIRALVRRYSLERPIVTHWEVGNEVDIGEMGGCPYLIPDPADYYAYYAATVEAILDVYPQAKVGGPGLANSRHPMLEPFAARCHARGTRLDFVSWHTYTRDARQTVDAFRQTVSMLHRIYGPTRPSVMVTEFGPAFEERSFPEHALAPRRILNVAENLYHALEGEIDYTFYYHVWDQLCDIREFAPFFQDPLIMYHHWNEVPHRFGLFSVEGEKRPAYDVYRLYHAAGTQRLGTECDPGPLLLQATRDEDGRLWAVILNPSEEDLALALTFRELECGLYRYENYRVGAAFSAASLDPVPVEARETYCLSTFTPEIYAPAQSVSFVRLIPLEK